MSSFRFDSIIFIEFAVGCPTGYAERNGDLPGWGTDIGSALDLSLENCVKRCDVEKTCLSFEHSRKYMKCNLNEIAEPTQGPTPDFIFCTKIGSILNLLNQILILKYLCLYTSQMTIYQYTTLCQIPTSRWWRTVTAQEMISSTPKNTDRSRMQKLLVGLITIALVLPPINVTGLFGICMKVGIPLLQRDHARG